MTNYRSLAIYPREKKPKNTRTIALTKYSFILASQSPRRHQLLLDAGIPHRVQPAAVPEVQAPGESATDFAVRLAREKAYAIPCDPGSLILGADTIVVVDDEVFGKPRDEDDARRMLSRLSGREHRVYTGICLRSDSRSVQDLAMTKVVFDSLTDQEISDYVASGEPVDKAGGYAIQGLASKYIASIDGSYQNVVGLPVALVYRHLKTFARDQE